MRGRPAHLVHVFRSFDRHGPQIRAATLINAFGARYRHTIIALDRNTGARALLDLDLDAGVIGLPDDQIWPRIQMLRLGNLLSLLGPDLLLSYGDTGAGLALINRVMRLAPQIHHLHSPMAVPARRHGGLNTVSRRLMVSSVARVVVDSPALERQALEVWGVPRERLALVAHGIDAARYERRPRRPTVDGPVPGLLLGAYVTMRKPDELLRLARALAATPHGETALLVINGDGPARGELVRLLVEHGLRSRVLLPGRSGATQLPLDEADIFVVTDDTERLPVSLLEAMASGLPVLGLCNGDLEALVAADNRGFFLGDQSDAALIAKLDALLRDHQLRARLGRANRARIAQDFSLTQMVDAYGRLIETVLARP